MRVYPHPCLESVFQAAPHGFLIVLFVRVQKLKQARDSVLDRDGVRPYPSFGR